jgi:hypothetical protein
VGIVSTFNGLGESTQGIFVLLRRGIQAVGGVVKALRDSGGQGCPVCSGGVPGAKEGGLVDRACQSSDSSEKISDPGGARHGRPRCSRMARIAPGVWIAARILIRPPQRGHSRASTAKTLWISSAQDRFGLGAALFGPELPSGVGASAGRQAPPGWGLPETGTMNLRSLAAGPRMPW